MDSTPAVENAFEDLTAAVSEHIDRMSSTIHSYFACNSTLTDQDKKNILDRVSDHISKEVLGVYEVLDIPFEDEDEDEDNAEYDEDELGYECMNESSIHEIDEGSNAPAVTLPSPPTEIPRHTLVRPSRVNREISTTEERFSNSIPRSRANSVSYPFYDNPHREHKCFSCLSPNLRPDHEMCYECWRRQA